MTREHPIRGEGHVDFLEESERSLPPAYLKMSGFYATLNFGHSGAPNFLEVFTQHEFWPFSGPSSPLTFHMSRTCGWEVIVQGDEGPVCGVAQGVDCHGVTVSHEEKEEEKVEQEVESDGEKTFKERCACPWMG